MTAGRKVQEPRTWPDTLSATQLGIHSFLIQEYPLLFSTEMVCRCLKSLQALADHALLGREQAFPKVHVRTLGNLLDARFFSGFIGKSSF
jgi:hypothetical protein